MCMCDPGSESRVGRKEREKQAEVDETIDVSSLYITYLLE